MTRIALFAALTCLFALWQFPGVTRADDGCPCPAGVCALQGCADCRACAACPQRLPAGPGCGSCAAPQGADACSSPRFPRLHAIAAHVRHPFGGRFAARR